MTSDWVHWQSNKKMQGEIAAHHWGSYEQLRMKRKEARQHQRPIHAPNGHTLTSSQFRLKNGGENRATQQPFIATKQQPCWTMHKTGCSPSIWEHISARLGFSMIFPWGFYQNRSKLCAPRAKLAARENSIFAVLDERKSPLALPRNVSWLVTQQHELHQH